MKTERIDHINIVVTDLEQAKAFFCLLGFKVRFEKELQGPWIDRVANLDGVHARFASLALPQAETVIELLQYLTPKGARDDKLGVANEIGIRHLALRVTDIDGWCERLRNHGVTVLSEIERPQAVGGKYAGKRLCYFLGPDGILLELMEYDADGA